MHWLWGILLGLILTAALPLLAGLLLVSGLVNQEDHMLVAVALITFCLLGIIIFKPTDSARQTRAFRGRVREDEE